MWSSCRSARSCSTADARSGLQHVSHRFSRRPTCCSSTASFQCRHFAGRRVARLRAPPAAAVDSRGPRAPAGHRRRFARNRRPPSQPATAARTLQATLRPSADARRHHRQFSQVAPCVLSDHPESAEKCADATKEPGHPENGPISRDFEGVSRRRLPPAGSGMPAASGPARKIRTPLSFPGPHIHVQRLVAVRQGRPSTFESVRTVVDTESHVPLRQAHSRGRPVRTGLHTDRDTRLAADRQVR